MKSELKCPECKNKGWKPIENMLKAVRVYHTDYFGALVIRYRECRNCGYKWKTREVFDSEVKEAPDLFTDQDRN